MKIRVTHQWNNSKTLFVLNTDEQNSRRKAMAPHTNFWTVVCLAVNLSLLTVLACAEDTGAFPTAYRHGHPRTQETALPLHRHLPWKREESKPQRTTATIRESSMEISMCGTCLIAGRFLPPPL